MIGINRQTKYSSLRKIFPFIKEALRTPKQTYCPNRWRVNADDLVGVNPFSCPVSINMFSRYAHCRKKSVKYYQNQVSPTNADDSASSHSSQHTLPLRACIIQWGTFKVGGDRWRDGPHELCRGSSRQGIGYLLFHVPVSQSSGPFLADRWNGLTDLIYQRDSNQGIDIVYFLRKTLVKKQPGNGIIYYRFRMDR